MIFFKTPIAPKRSDFSANEINIQYAENINKRIEENKIRYSENNSKFSYILAYLVLALISGLIISSYKPTITGFALIFLACSCAFLAMLPVGFTLAVFFENLGKDIEPNRTPQKDNEYTYANSYIQAKNKYELELENLKILFPEIEECNFDVKRYNEHLIQFFKQRLDNLIHNERIDELRKYIGPLGEGLFSNLDLIGCKNTNKLHHTLYKADFEDSQVLITYRKTIDRDCIDDFVKDLKHHDITKGIIIIKNKCNNKWYIDLIKRNNIQLVNIEAFEQIIIRKLNMPKLSFQQDISVPKVRYNPPFETIDFTYTYDGERKLYSGFNFQLVREVFSNKKDIYEKVITTPKEDGAYGIIKYSGIHNIYGLMFFENMSQLDYYKGFICAAIDNRTKKYSNIVYDYTYHGYYRPHQYKYECWLDYYRDSCSL